MSRTNLSRKTILEMIANREISREEGMKLLMELGKDTEASQPTIYFSREWEEWAIGSSASGKESKGCLLVFDNNEEIASTLRKDQEKWIESVVLVRPGKSFKEVGGSHYEINPGEAEDYKKLIETLVSKELTPLNVLHMWSEDAFETDGDKLAEQLDKGVYSLFNLSRAVMEQKIKGKIHIVYTYRYHKGECQPVYEAVKGFARSIRLENPNMMFKTIGVEKSQSNALNSDVALLLKEFSTNSFDEVEISYRDNKRYARRLKEYTPGTAPVKAVQLKENGVYIITGGTGGLGYIFAKYLAEKFKAKIVLTGRSEYNNQTKERLDSLKALGADATYIRADVSRIEEVERLAKETVNLFDEVNGIIHSAGVINDSFVLNKKKEEMDSVISSKVYGAVNLYDTFNSHNLDFLVLFSSVAAVIGNLGQCDYAYANSFMDSLAEMEAQKSNFKILSINWPLWKDGGMKTGEETVSMLKKSFGIDMLTTENGLNAFEYGLKNAGHQLIVFEGDSNKIKTMLVKERKEEAPKENNAAEESSNIEAYGDLSQLQTKTEEYLKDLLSKITKVPKSSLDPQDSFEKIGLDSILAMNINEELEGQFGELSKTLLFEYQTIRDLAEFFVENYQEILVKKFGSMKAPEKKKEVTTAVAKKEPAAERRSRFMTADGSRETKEAPKGTETGRKVAVDDVEIAIIGISARFPMARNLEEFWINLKAGRDCITEVPKDRWDIDEYYDPDKNKLGTTYNRWGGFIDDVDKFDALFFNVSPREAELMDPQERIFLESVYHTLEDAGYTKNTIGTDKIGVYVGVMYGQYQMIDAEMEGNKIALASVYASISNRVSYHLNFSGPSIALDTMCSSSLTALHLACDSLRKGESDLAIAGGVNVNIHPSKYIFLSQQKFAASDGRCHSFGEGGDGYVPGEGVGAVLLKPLNKALADGDHIYAVVKGTAVNHGAKTSGFTVPNPNAQGNVILDVLKKANIDPRTLSYIEAHGTGTALGDPIEVAGLVKAFKDYTKEKQFCSIGSVKSNIGHLESAAGIASIAKVLLQMRYGQLVPSIHSDVLNPNINFENSPFYVQHKVEEWKRPVINENGKEKTYPRRAGISSFGAGGSNAHVILEEYMVKEEQNISEETEPQLIVLSARNEERLKTYAGVLANFLEKAAASAEDGETKEQPRLEDIAYTLHVGREPMTERLALVVSSIDELRELLSDFSQGKPAGDKTFRGNVKNNKERADILLDGREGKEFLEIIISDRKLSKLAQLWVSGVELDWKLLYSDNTYSRVSLPGYPFERKRYWVTEASKKNMALSGGKGQVEKLHPMLERNTSSITELKFASRIDAIESLFAEYTLNGANLMPGTSLIEMVRAASEIAGQKKVTGVKNVQWSGALTLSSVSNELEVGLYPQSNSIACEVRSNDGTIYLQGTAIYDTNQMEAGENINIEGLKAKVPYKLEKAEVYKKLGDTGLTCASGAQTINQLYKSDRSALAMLSIPGAKLLDMDGYVLNPVLIDGAVQAAAMLIQSEGGAFLPYSMSEVSIFKPVTEKCQVYVERLDHNHKDGNDIQTFDVNFLDENGNVLIQIKKLSLRSVKYAVAGGGAVLETAYYGREWEALEVTSRVSTTDIKGDVLVFDIDTGLTTVLRNNSNVRTVLVKPGKGFQDNGSGEYEINASNKEDFIRLVESLKNKAFKTEQIIFMWSRYSENLDISLDTGVYSLLYLSQVLMEQKSGDRTQLLYIYNKAENGIYALDAAISGYAKSLRLENPKFVFKTIEMADNSKHVNANNILELAAREFAEGQKGEIEIRYDNNNRFVKRVRELEAPVNGVKYLPIKEKGVYLITGGAGGLGLIFADYLARNYKARLILTGRSELKEDTIGKIKGLEALGAEVEYVRSDASIKADTDSLMNTIKNRFGRLDGIIHSAGVNRDSFILKKTKQDMEQIVASKVRGTLNLDEATKDENMDFFVLFSSITGETGNLGQSDYAYANSFLDNFAYQREEMRLSGKRKGITISMGWPLWEDGGMHIAKEQLQMLAEQTGLNAIPRIEGIKAWEAAFTFDLPGVIISYGDKQKINNFLIPSDAVQEAAATEETVLPEAELLLEKAESYLIDVFSQLLKLTPEEIDPDLTFQEYGVESVMVNYFNTKLEQDFGALPKTLLFEYQSIRELSRYLAKDQAQALTRLFQLGGAASEAPKAENTVKVSGGARILWSALKPLGTGGQSAKGFAGLQVSNIEPEDDIAIIGLSGRYPQAENPDEFWNNLVEGRDSVTEIPLSRWDYRKYYDPDYDKIKEGKMYCKWGAFLDDVDKFDPFFFNISPREAEIMDPQERIFIESVWTALEDSGYTKEKIKKFYGREGGSNVGVYVGTTSYTYQLWGPEEWARGNLSSMPNSSPWSIANRVSYVFNFNGPSMPVDTACSSSLTAIHLACESLKKGECELAVAGGVNLYLHPYKYVLMCQTRMLSPTGRCHSFSDNGDGFVPGEGVGAVILKPLKKAVRDRDQIYAVIKATSVNHGGRTNGYTVPNPNAQAGVISDALKKSGIDARTITCIEAHGTGTKLGDPIEITGLNKAFGEYTSDKQYCSIGSVKSNIGHLESAAGMSSLTKVLLQLKHKKLAPSIHAEKLNSNIDFEGSHFYIQNKLEDWKETIIMENGNMTVYPRRAGISSFGAGGANAHIIVEEYSQEEQYSNNNGQEPQVIVLSAKTRESLKEAAIRLNGFIKKAQSLNTQLYMRDVAYTLQLGREAMDERLAFVAEDIKDIAVKLERYLRDEISGTEILTGNVKKLRAAKSGDSSVKDAAGALSGYIKGGELLKVAELWLHGVQVDWTLLHEGRDSRVISLPTYAFAKESYWVSRTEAPIAGVSAQLHPMIGSNTSNFREQRYTTEITGAEFFVNSNTATGQKLMSEAAVIEIFRAAGELAAEDTITSIRNLLWEMPVWIDQNPVTIHTSLYPNGDIVECELSSAGQNNTRKVHAQGQLVFENGNQRQTGAEVTNVSTLRERCTMRINSAEFYERLQNLKAGNIPQNRAVYEFLAGSNEALVSMKLSEGSGNGLKEIKVNPVLLQGALQAVQVLLAGEGEYVPHRLEEVKIISQLPEDCLAYVDVSNRTADDVTVNITLMDAVGHILVMLKGLTLKKTAGSTGAKNSSNSSTDNIKDLLRKLEAGEVDISYVRQYMEVADE